MEAFMGPVPEKAASPVTAVTSAHETSAHDTAARAVWASFGQPASEEAFVR